MSVTKGSDRGATMRNIVVAVLIGTSSFAEAFTTNALKKQQKVIDPQKCTSIGVGPKAMIDGSTVTTHNNDCQECDLRITHVPAKAWPAGSFRPIHDIRDHYPRYIEDIGDKLNIHGPDYSPHLVDTSIYNWTYIKPMGFIDQVEYTYAYTLGTYAIQNEKQLSIGESTCSSKFVARPINAQGGKALFHMETLTEIAMERCATARCAIKTMGDLAVRFGFYGGGWDGDLVGAQDEAGEALTISDPTETWMFHLLADDTGASAVWAAQRVPDDHITAVANQFVIGELDLSDSLNYLASENILDVAIRTKLWDPATALTKPFNFGWIYGNNRQSTGFACTRRVWRVFTLAAPSLLATFSPYTDGLGTFGFGPDGSLPYPFSVKPDVPLTVQDIMNMNRDQYEGSPFDLTKGTDGGPFGDPMRWPAVSKFDDKVEGVSWDAQQSGLGFQRSISLWRTAYSTVTQSRASLPDVVGAVTWIAPYAPHHSTFVPVYASAPLTPSSLNAGTQYKFDKEANWWIHCLTSNYLSRWYTYTIRSVNDHQKTLEKELFARQIEVEAHAVLLSGYRGRTPSESAIDLDTVPHVASTRETAATYLGKYHEEAALKVREQWWSFFFQMAGKFRDMYEVVDPHTENFIDSYAYLGAPRWWFEQIGFWGAPGTPPADEIAPVGIMAINVPAEPSQEAYRERYPDGFSTPYASVISAGTAPAKSVGMSSIVLSVFIFLLGTVIGGCLTMLTVKNRTAYSQLN